MNSILEIEFVPIPTEKVRAIQDGGPDANGQRSERFISDGDGVPCRHCLQGVTKGEPYLLLSYRPFSTAQPFAEVGPIFLHQAHCEPYRNSLKLPPMLARDQYIIRGYDSNERIVYGTGRVVKTTKLREEAIELLRDPKVSYLHVRSAAYNCYHCRINKVATGPGGSLS